MSINQVGVVDLAGRRAAPPGVEWGRKGRRRLRIGANLQVEGIERKEVRVLIDTGAEICLIRKGLFPRGLFSNTERPFRLTTANRQQLEGEIECCIV